MLAIFVSSLYVQRQKLALSDELNRGGTFPSNLKMVVDLAFEIV
jgi:hypothetical protein